MLVNRAEEKTPKICKLTKKVQEHIKSRCIIADCQIQDVTNIIINIIILIYYNIIN